MELRDYFAIMLKWWYVILLGTACAAVIAFGVGKATTVYEASTIVKATEMFESEEVYQEVIQKPTLLAEVIAELDITSTPEKLGEIVKVQTVEDSKFLKITASYGNPVIARDIVNELFAVLNKERTLNRVDEIEYELELQETQKAATLAQITPDKSPEELAPLQETYIRIVNTIAVYNEIKNEIHPDETTYNSFTVFVPSTLESIYATTEPDIWLVIGVGAVLGLAISIGIVFLRHYSLNRVETKEDVRRITGLPVLGTITKAHNPWDKNPVTDKNAESHMIADFWKLKTSLYLHTQDKAALSILITSIKPQEGKTTILANLARVIADAGQRVIVIDSNMRHPDLDNFFEVPNEPGLTDYYSHDNPELSNFIKPTRFDGVQILTSGSVPANPSQLIGSSKLSNLWKMIGEEADVILLDSPSFTAAADSLILASQVDGVILVVDTKKTRVEDLKLAKETFSVNGINILGVVLNRAT